MKVCRKSNDEMIEGNTIIYDTEPYQVSELDSNLGVDDIVIQGWVARDEEVGNIWLFKNEPTRNTDLSYGFWDGNNDDFIELPTDLFPDLTWESEPLEVEIIIKRKKNG